MRAEQKKESGARASARKARTGQEEGEEQCRLGREKQYRGERERGSEKPGCSAYAYNDQPPTPPMGVLDSSSSPRVVVTMTDDK